MSIEEIVQLCVKNWIKLYLVWSIFWLPYNIRIYHTKYPAASVWYLMIMLIRRIVFAGQGVYWYLLILERV